MFDFLNLDQVDVEDAAPEWVKWHGVPDWQRAQQDSPAVLEDLREEEYAAPEDEYKFEKIDIPNLNEDTAYDPMGIISEDMDAVEDMYATYNGQVILNFITGAYDDYQSQEHEKEERKAYIDALHEERLSIVNSSGGAMADTEKSKIIGGKSFDRKQFSWREVSCPLVASFMGLPDGGAVAECALSNSSRVLKSLTKIEGYCCMPPAILVQQLIALAQNTRPNPASGRMTRNTVVHLALTDIFFPAAMLIDEAEDIITSKGTPPQLAHLVAIACNKEIGEVEPKHLLENVKLGTPNNMPKSRRRM